MAQTSWSPAGRGARLRVDVTQVLTDPKAALAAVLDATPGWQVRRRLLPLPPPAASHMPSRFLIVLIGCCKPAASQQ